MVAAPLLRYQKELWLTTTPSIKQDDVLPLGTLVQAFEVSAAQEALALCRSLPPTPIAAAIRAARRLGWVFHNATVIHDTKGDSIELLHGGPAAFKQQVVFAWRQESERLVLQSLRAKGCSGTEALQAGIAWEASRRLVMPTSIVSPLHRQHIRCLVAGRYATGQVWCKRGVLATAKCPLCDCPEDTLFHRPYDCQHPAVATAREG